MNVVVDIGNTCIKWARAEGCRIDAPARASHRESLSAALDTFVASLPENIDAVWVTNVGGDAIVSELRARLRRARGIEPRLIESTTHEEGLRAVYSDPARLGADRWAAMIAARNQFIGPVCVIDAGTTVTFDAVDAEGQHLGGLILAGPRMTVEALRRNTEQVSATLGVAERPIGLNVLGKSTDGAVGHGVMLALAGAIDQAAEAVADALGLEPTVLLTGGDARTLEPWLKTSVRHKEHLVLEGLALLAKSRGER